MSRPITEAEVDKAVELANKGMNYTEIGKAIGRTPYIISIHLKRRGVFVEPQLKLSNIEIENLQNRLNNRESVKDIANEMGIKPQSLNSYIQRLRKRGYDFSFRMTPEDEQFIIHNYDKMSLKDICRVTGRTVYRVKQVVEKNQLQTRKEKVKEVIARYPYEDTLALANEYGLSVSYVRSVANHRGIKKTKKAKSLYGKTVVNSRVHNLINGIV